MANALRKTDSTKSNIQMQPSTGLFSREGLWSRLRRGPEARIRFVESHLSKNLAFQIRAMRDREGWSQQELAEKLGMNQNAISRIENPGYGKQTLTTLKRVASVFDVCLAVRFVPFTEMVDWVTGTPHLNRGLRTENLAVPTFAMEEGARVVDSMIIPDSLAAKVFGTDRPGNDSGKKTDEGDSLLRRKEPARAPLTHIPTTGTEALYETHSSRAR